MLILICLFMLIGLCGLLIFITFNKGHFKSLFLFTLIMLSLLVLAIMLTSLATEVSDNLELDYEAALDKREALVYWRDFVEPSSPLNTEIQRQIDEFNQELSLHKKYLGDPWRGIFWNEKIATINYIE